MTPARRLIAGLGALVLATSLAACGDSEDTARRDPARPASVALASDGVPDDLSIGVIVSLNSAPGEGSDWRDVAAGARVASYRYQLGGADVRIEPADDKGTPQGAQEAVKKLAADGVAGIVVASEGMHVQALVAAAKKADLPVVLPYDTSNTSWPDGVWATGPDDTEVGTRLASAISRRDLTRPLLINAGGRTLREVKPTGSRTVGANTDLTAFARNLGKTVREKRSFDSIMVTGSAGQQAVVVQALQGQGLGLPVFLTPAALSPVFTASLLGNNGTLAGSLTTVGADVSDPGALESAGSGAALSAYFAAVRAAAQDTDVKDLFDGAPFAEVSSMADTRSHDGVVALVQAAIKADSSKPADVSTALAGLKLDHADGIAGPALDFGSPHALAQGSVVALNASEHDPNLRTTQTGTVRKQLFWFRAATQ